MLSRHLSRLQPRCCLKSYQASGEAAQLRPCLQALSLLAVLEEPRSLRLLQLPRNFAFLMRLMTSMTSMTSMNSNGTGDHQPPLRDNDARSFSSLPLLFSIFSVGVLPSDLRVLWSSSHQHP